MAGLSVLVVGGEAGYGLRVEPRGAVAANNALEAALAREADAEAEALERLSRAVGASGAGRTRR